MTLPARPNLTTFHPRDPHKSKLSGRRLLLCSLGLLSAGSFYLLATNRASVQEIEQFPTSSIGVRGSNPIHASRLPRWTGWKADIGGPNNYGRVTLTGSYRFPLPSENAAADTYGVIHFPTFDLKGHIQVDEAENAMKNSFRGLFQGSVGDIALVPPVYTKGVESQPDYALLTRCGFKTAASPTTTMNQDRSFLLSFSDRNWIMVLLDGHGEGGHVVSHFAALELPQRLPLRLRDSAKSVDQAVRETFLEVERDLPENAGHAGSTAIVVYRDGDKLYVANTGDSLAIVVSYDPSTDQADIVYQTQPHKPHLPEERSRIESLGGEVLLPSETLNGDTTSRVLVPAGDGINYLALAMSRSIGDKEAIPIGVIANPTVDAHDVRKWSGKKLFVVAASDGIWDRIPPSDVAQHLARSLYNQQGNVVTPLEACEQLIMQSSKRWISNGPPYRDDITIAVTKLIT